MAGLLCALALWPALAQTQRTSRIDDSINTKVRITRTGNRHPMARAEYDQGPAPGDLRMDRMMLVLDASPAQQQELDALVEAQQNSTSPQFHRFLTPEEFGLRFGVSVEDLSKTSTWLQSQGFTVEPPDSSRRTLIFSGNAGQVEAAFNTPIHIYNVKGKRHYANATDPEIPSALAQVVHGVVTLHDFGPTPQLIHGGSVPQLTSGGSHYLGPADFATIYNVRDLYNSSIDGSGQSVAVIARSNFNLADVQSFRSHFGLPAKDPSIVLAGTDPGVLASNELEEATLDVQWAGAIAKNANVRFVLAGSTTASDGVVLASQYAVNQNIAPVISLSFGSCEAALGSSGNRFWNSLWQQAAAQGITVLVASGDSGAAGCDTPTAATGTQASVNGLCSSPYATCVGGTQFMDDSNSGAYWLSSSDPTTFASALSYIPEAAWNQSASAGGSGLWSSSGGASSYYAKPSWQTGPGVPPDGRRDVPDVSLNASTHDGYVCTLNGQLTIFGGTSASTPSMAGIVAMLNQKLGSRQGNLNSTLYSLASSNSAIFHDVLTSNNTVPGVNGYNAGAGYDLVSGLGSVDAARMVNGWSQAVPPSATVQVTVTPSSVTLAAGSSIQTGASQTQQFGATVTGTANTSVTWRLSPATGAGTISSTGLYTAPATISNPQTVIVTATSVADATKSGSATVTLNPPVVSAFTPIRVNAGGSGYRDSATGNVWAADTGFLSGSSYSTGNPISNTTTPVLYQTERWSSGTLEYQFAVPNGTYTVNLKFAEIYYSTSGQRVFNLVLNGQTVTPNFDPAAAAGGGNRAVDKAFSVTVNSGVIDIQLVPVLSSPKISAIEITSVGTPAVSVGVTPTSTSLKQSQTQQFGATVTGTANTSVTWYLNPATGAGTISSTGLYTAPATISNPQTVIVTATSVADATKSGSATVTLNPPVVSAFTPIRVNAGGPGYTDSVTGNVWAADTGFLSGSAYSTGSPISNTATPVLYQTERWSSGTLEYQFAVPNGTYTVNLKFAEIYYSTSGQRVFNLVLNGQTVTPNFDPAAAAGGGNRAVDKAFSVTVSNGVIDIQLVPVLSAPKISAIEIHQ